MNRKGITFFRGIFAALVLAGLAGLTMAQNVYYNPANAVGSGHVDLIEFAAWSWAERTGMAVEYAGTTTAGECVANAITIRTAVLAEWNMAMDAIQATPAERTGFRGFTFTCPYGGYTLLLSPHWSVNRITILHELGHGLRGFGHTGAYFAAMNAAAAAEALITDWDIDFILASPDWPVPFAASYCHVEVANDMDLMISEIDDRRVRLNYEGSVDGHHTWGAAMNEIIYDSGPGCTNATLHSNGDVTLADIRSEAGNYSAAYLQYMPATNKWRLTSLTP